MIDVKKYTSYSLGKQLVLTEWHLTDYLQETGGIPPELKVDETDYAWVTKRNGGTAFCIECLAKHALGIGGLADEGTQFFDNNPYFTALANVAANLYEATTDFDRTKATAFYNELRSLRKELVAQHLVLGAMDTSPKHHLAQSIIRR